MKTEITLILPTQLFAHNPAITKERLVVIAELPRYFSDFQFHKQKLILHRASMKSYQQSLENKGYNTQYLEHQLSQDIVESCAQAGVKKIHLVDPIDIPLEKSFKAAAKKKNIVLVFYESPAFLTDSTTIKEYIDQKERFLMAPFYQWQRKRLDILMHKGKPVGGRWSYDTENRKSFPKTAQIPEYFKPRRSANIIEVIGSVEQEFKNNPGIGDNFWFPTDHASAQRSLEHFLEYRFCGFGPYQDAVVAKEPVLFHSVLSSSLNSGLLTPEHVVTTTLDYAKSNKIPIASSEGFIRQVIGWREFVRLVYQAKQDEQRTTNFWGFKTKLPSSYWNGTTTIEPIDTLILKTLSSAYLHHIERLMFVGNFMLLSHIDPDSVYKWFMELFIDAYDWVMVPNIYGMSQYADGGLMTTKPYISSSNYVRKMSDFKAGAWCDLWDALYWHFIGANRTVIEKNARLKIMVSMLNRLDKSKQIAMKKLANHYLQSL